MQDDTEPLLPNVLLLDLIATGEEAIVIGTQPTEATIIARPLGDIEAHQEEELHQGTEAGGAVAEAYLAALLAIVTDQEVAMVVGAQHVAVHLFLRNYDHVVVEMYVLTSAGQLLGAGAHRCQGPCPGLAPDLAHLLIHHLRSELPRRSQYHHPAVLVERRVWFLMEMALQILLASSEQSF